jgi:hypothetical protein
MCCGLNRLNSDATIQFLTPRERRDQGPSHADWRSAVKGCVKACDPTPHYGVNVEIHDGTLHPVRREHKTESLDLRARYLAVSQRYQLPDLFII